MRIGLWIKKYREKNNLFQEDFGRMVGVNKQTVSRWESGSLEPSTEMYYTIAEAIGVELSHILLSDIEDIEDLPVYQDTRIYNVGINSAFESICDIYTLNTFADMAVEVYNISVKSGPMAFCLLNESMLDEKSPENILIANEIFPLFDTIEFNLDGDDYGYISIPNEKVRLVVPVSNFKNELYVVDIVFNSKDEESEQDALKMQLCFNLGYLKNSDESSSETDGLF